MSNAINIDQTLARVRDAEQHLEERSVDKARSILLEIAAATNRAGVISPHLQWLLAVVHDQLGDREAAFSYITTAISMDPLSIACRHSFSVITAHIRADLRSPERSADDASTPKLWELLARSGEADDETHVVMARYQFAKGNTVEAQRILDCLTTLNPACKEGWALKSIVAAKLGDQRLAEQAAAEAAVLGVRPVPFCIPGRAEG